MLYELLLGRLPEDPAETGLQQFLVRLSMRETNPPTPSARLTTLANVRDTLARLRATDAVGLRSALRGDLDRVVKSPRPEHPYVGAALISMADSYGALNRDSAALLEKQGRTKEAEELLAPP
jgi:hypothetical protein